MGISRRFASRSSKKWAVVGSVLVGVVPTAAIVTSISSQASSAPNAVTHPVGGSMNVIVFPQRDFVSASGYDAENRVLVRVFHDTGVYAGHGAPVLSQVVTPKGDPAGAPGTFSGIVEVNHPGGACWDTTTPDIRPGDLVQLEVVGGGGPNMGRTDETIVANVTNKRAVQTGPGTIQVHGTARDAFGVAPGNPLDVTTVEQRLVAPGSRLELNGRRTLRATSLAGADGTLSYDPGSPNWTATYSGLSAADVTLALGAESRSLWLGNVAPPAVESTIYENGALTFPGPGAPCTAPLERGRPDRTVGPDRRHRRGQSGEPRERRLGHPDVQPVDRQRRRPPLHRAPQRLDARLAQGLPGVDRGPVRDPRRRPEVRCLRVRRRGLRWCGAGQHGVVDAHPRHGGGRA